MLQLILMRHGARVRTPKGNREADRCSPLTDTAHAEARALAPRLKALIGSVGSVRCSDYLHAIQTAEIVIETLEPTLGRPQQAQFLTPHEMSGTPHWADDEAFSTLLTLLTVPGKTVVHIWVGHETRLSQLVLRYTGVRQRQLEALEAVCVAGEDAAQLLSGRGHIAWRFPVRNWLEEALKPKLESKMLVATFLAGANFVALTELLIGGRKDLVSPSSTLPPTLTMLGDSIVPATAQGIAHAIVLAALGSFFIAAMLFVATVYLYDRLAMPVGFWTRKPYTDRRATADEPREQTLLHGYSYHHMVRVWSHVFTIGVCFSFLGLTLLVINAIHPVGFALYVVAAAAVYFWYRCLRPTADID